MDVTEKCIIEAKQGFESTITNRFTVIKVKAQNGDAIRVNDIEGVKYREIWVAYEHPRHDDAQVVDKDNLVILVGGEPGTSERAICIIGK